MMGIHDSTLVKSTGSQLFIEFATNGNGVAKGFSASIEFGIRDYVCDIRAYYYYTYSNV